MSVKRSPPPHHATHQSRGREQRLLRIIAGQWRGKKFRFPELDIRPTPDRVRETLFKWLQGRVEGAHCLDLYAGSGALGLEALSRGAASVVFVEHQRAAVNALRELLRDWQVSNATVVCDEAQHYLAGNRALGADSADGGRGFDLVFLDPPYASGELRAAAAALARSGLAPQARIYVEQRAADEPSPALPATWRELRAGKAGEVRYHLFAA
jgi:16S rRNA (guanine966-N2)-methyltransferase